MLGVKSVPVTVTAATGLKYWLTGWFFTETGGSTALAVTIRSNDGSGAVIWQASVPASSSIGVDLVNPIKLAKMATVATNIHVTISGGTCVGAVRGY